MVNGELALAGRREERAQLDLSMYILYNSTENADNTLASRNGRNKDGGCTHVGVHLNRKGGKGSKGTLKEHQNRLKSLKGTWNSCKAHSPDILSP